MFLAHVMGLFPFKNFSPRYKMDITTGREFPYTNPQDDPELYPRLPPGLRYSYDGSIHAEPIRTLPSVPGQIRSHVMPRKQAVAFPLPPNFSTEKIVPVVRR